ncbi:HAMP domain-containing histidine kinase [Pseudonocardia xinjiangensis]|uniref:histidine kinase n=2 Tax=Pseudonocardia xinjiangensis TaxID=75289 RepID=A0ABX1RFQ2_9PSEU|nr:HAMP domain-containing histidine kinase [Pseudonocardia xinjiangensis]
MQQLIDRVEGNYEGSSNENAREAIRVLANTPDDLVQVLVRYESDDDEDDVTVIEGGSDAAGRSQPLSSLWPQDGQRVVLPKTEVTRADGSRVPAVLVAAGTVSAGNHVAIYVALPLTSVQTATDTVLFYLLFGVPILILVTGITTYYFAGRALRPVEAIRARVAAMSEKDLAQRVPVPGARDEVGRLAETMNAMIGRLQDAQGVQRRFVADASHELRSPLATIATGLELMQRGPTDPGTVTALRGETERLNRLVDALLLLARADERGLQPRREEVDLDEVAESERGRPSDSRVVAEVHAEPVRVIGDRGQLARVVRNLVDNARRHARSRVIVTVTREESTAVIEVSDDGPGVPAEDRGRVFERFVRLDSARARADGGSGLGLAIVAEVVAAHGGSVTVDDAPGGGARFRVRLPATLPQEPLAEGTPAAPWRPVAPAPSTAYAQRPVRDEDAKRDPETRPWGIPAVPGGEETSPWGTPGVPLTDPNGLPVPRQWRGGSGVADDQRGSIIR